MPKNATAQESSSTINTKKLSRLLLERFGVSCDAVQLDSILDEAAKTEASTRKKEESNGYISISRISTLISKQLALNKRRKIPMSATLQDDLALDSFDLLEIIKVCSVPVNVEFPVKEKSLRQVSDLVAAIRFEQFVQQYANPTYNESQAQLMRSLISASLQCPPGTWMEYHAKKQVMRALEKKGWVLMENVNGESYRAKVCDHDLIAR